MISKSPVGKNEIGSVKQADLPSFIRTAHQTGLDLTAGAPASERGMAKLFCGIRGEEGGIIVQTLMGISIGAVAGGLGGYVVGGPEAAAICTPVGAFLGAFLLRKPWAVAGMIIGAVTGGLTGYFEGGPNDVKQVALAGALLGTFLLRKPQAVVGTFIGAAAWGLISYFIGGSEAVKIFAPLGAFVGCIAGNIM